MSALVERAEGSVSYQNIQQLIIEPLTSEHWSDFEELFGPRGACGGCWCMYWRLNRTRYERQKGDLNQDAMREIVDSGEPAGLLGYVEGKAVAWCALAPREAFTRLQASRILKPVDDQPVWSIVCLFVTKAFRKRGLTVELLKGAVNYVADHGGKVVEGYPVDPANERMPDVFAWTGLASAFHQAGFKECARRSETRPIMRYEI